MLFNTSNKIIIKKIFNNNKKVIYNTIADVDKYSHFLPYCLYSKTIKKYNNNLFDTKIIFSNNIITDTSFYQIKLNENEISSNLIKSNFFSKFKSKWIFDNEINNNKNLLILDIEYQLKNYDFLFNKFIYERILNQQIEYFDNQINIVKNNMS